MNQHELTRLRRAVLCAADLYGQANRLHRFSAGRQSVPAPGQVQMAGVQAERTVVSILNTRKQGRSRNRTVTVDAPEIPVEFIQTIRPPEAEAAPVTPGLLR
jgi:hypothetical protein